MNPDLKGVLILTGVVSAISLAGLAGLAYGADEEDCQTVTHCAAMRLPMWHEDRGEDPEEQAARLLLMTNGLDAATDDALERALLLQQAHSETRFARFVMFDDERCREGIDGWCDGGKALGPWQLHNVARDTPLAQQASIALRQLRFGGTYCQRRGNDYIEGAISVYATGRYVCDWPEAKDRARKTWRIWGQIQ